VWVDPGSAHDTIEYWFGEKSYLTAGATKFVETQLTVPPRWYRIVSHTLAHREKDEPNTLFVGRISREEHRRLFLDAAVAHRQRQEEMRLAAKAIKPHTEKMVLWEELSHRQQALLRGKDLSPYECWPWKSIKHLRRKTVEERKSDPAPYRDFYVSIKGPVPRGVHLRHKCDNRHCMNPNHLEPGASRDNVKDMMDRGRHYRTVRRRKSARVS